MINFDIKLGFKEIAAIVIGVPLCYEKLRKLKIKYDAREQKTRENNCSGGVVFSDIFIDAEGRKWRRER